MHLTGIVLMCLGLHMSGSDLFNTKTNNQTEHVGFLINQSDPTDGEDLNRTTYDGSYFQHYLCIKLS